MYKFKFAVKKDLPKTIVQKGILMGLAEIVYIFLIALFFLAGQAVFPVGPSNPVLSMMALLILLVASVAVSGALIFGCPLYHVLQKKYNEAVVALASTIITLLAFFVIFIIAALIIS